MKNPQRHSWISRATILAIVVSASVILLNGILASVSESGAWFPADALGGQVQTAPPRVSSNAAAAAIVVDHPCQWREPRREEADDRVSTAAELVNAIADGAKLIWVETAASIDLGAADHPDRPKWVLVIPDGVTLASGRSPTSRGGRLYFSKRLPTQRFMLRLGQCSRVTGLRLQGPSRSTARRQSRPPYAKHPRTTAIHVLSTEGHRVDRVIIDNNEFFDWPGAGVHVQEVPTTFETARHIRVANNFFHHNLMCGSGYGVVLDGNNAAAGGYVFIDRNVFNFNRHAVAGDGHPTSGYVAEWNLVLSGGKKCDNGVLGDPGYYEQHFDMHGKGLDGYGGDAGEVIRIRYNTIRGEQDYYLVKTRPAFYLRGIPVKEAYFFGNVLAHDNRSEAIRTHGNIPNLRVFENRYDVDTSFDLATGDFDGDGAADVFQATGTVWVFSARGQSEWRHLKNDFRRLSRLLLGDFDGNGKTDLFTQVNKNWQVSYDGVSPWTPLPAGSEIDMQTYRLGDFNGDGKTDVFRANGTRWFYSSGAATGWLPLARSAYRVEDIRLGDFNGDHTTDVFSFANGEWSVSYGGRSVWTRLNKKISAKLSDLVFADFNGDGVTDIGRHKGIHYQVSWGGTTEWRKLHSAAYLGMPVRLPKLLLGDFNGDGNTDALHYQHNLVSFGTFGVGERFVMSNGASQDYTVRSRHEMR
jgi:hypothetical protein